MVDLASPVLGGFQDTLEAAFGPSWGWVAGHAIVLSIALLLVMMIRNRDHIMSESGFGKSHMADAVVVLALVGVQYVIYTDSMDFPASTSFVLGIIGALSLRWMVLVLE
ncbi:MAG: hypothetical protein VYB86_04000 [Candidatus Thermoplasmatota archaeon]|nr:hypothetical protein [Candidatus Thermoplasmatota archaeon]